MKRRFLTLNELAERWYVLPKIIRIMIKRGQVRAYKIGRVIRINLDDVVVIERKAVLMNIKES